jgi:hypothetical protein
MAPSFLKDLRRRSRASFKNERSVESDETTHSNGTNGTNSSTDMSGVTLNVFNGSVYGSVPTAKSSSTLNSLYGGTTPPTLTTSNSASNLQSLVNLALPARSAVQTSSSNRYSVSGMSGLGVPSPKSSLPASPYAPRVQSISDGAWVSTINFWGYVEV